MGVYKTPTDAADQAVITTSAAYIPVTVTASEDFSANDLVFVDTKQLTYHKLQDIPASLAIASGPATLAYASDQVAANACAGVEVRLADGTRITIASSHDASNNYHLVVLRTNARGLQLSKYILIVSTANVIQDLAAVLLSNGNVALTYSNAGVGAWVILSPTGQPLYSGSTPSGSNAIFYMQETNNGGFMFVHATGVSFVSAVGAVTALVTTTISSAASLGYQTEFNEDLSKLYDQRASIRGNRAPVKISGNGFAFFFIVGNASIASFQANADGTARSALITVATFAAQSINSLRVAAAPGGSGNVCWAYCLQSNPGAYGILNDAGGIVLVATAAASIVAGGSDLKVMADSAGNFLIAAWSGAASYNAYYISGTTGAPKATYPKVLSTSVTQTAALYRLSTGFVFINARATYILRMSFVDLAGTVTQRDMWDFTNGAGSHVIGGFVFNDTVYGAIAVGASGNADGAVFSIPNTGVPDVLPMYTGTPLVSTTALWVGADVGGSSFHVLSDGIVASYTLNQSKAFVQTYTNALLKGLGKVKFQPFGLIIHDPVAGANGPGAASSTAVLAIKFRTTQLYGVAAGAAANGTPLVINTKGLFPTTFTGFSGNFDHSANNPPGAKGFINAGTVSFVGY